MSVEQLQTAAAALGELNERVVYMGGASVALWQTDPAGRRPRVTDDVDVIAEVANLAEYEAFQNALRQLGFAEDIESGVMVRWKHESIDLTLDAVPAAERLAGLRDPWLASALATAVTRTLPSETVIRAVPPEWLVVLKTQAFNDRGDDDCLSSRDFEDIVLLLDTREELLEEVAGLPPDAREFVRDELGRIRGLPTFTYGFEGAIGSIEGRARMDAVTRPRFEALLSP